MRVETELCPQSLGPLIEIKPSHDRALAIKALGFDWCDFHHCVTKNDIKGQSLCRVLKF